MATVVEDWPTFTYTPTDEELEWERAYWEEMDRIAAYDAYVAAMADEQEHEPNWDCDCEQCREAQDEWREAGAYAPAPVEGLAMAFDGTVYLLHFSQPYQHARHYLGWTTNLDSRLDAHRTGQGARLMAVIKDAGLTFELARTWSGDRYLERRLKHRGGHGRLCPICQRKEA